MKKLFVLIGILSTLTLSGCGGGTNKQKLAITPIYTREGKIFSTGNKIIVSVDKKLKLKEDESASFGIYYDTWFNEPNIPKAPQIVVLKLEGEYWLADYVQHEKYTSAHPAHIRLGNLHKLTANDTLSSLPQRPTVLDPHEKGLTWQWDYDDPDNFSMTVGDYDASKVFEKLKKSKVHNKHTESSKKPKKL